jgi:pectate lyase
MRQRLMTVAAGAPGMLATLLFLIVPARAQASEGFGAATLGGAGKPLCHVTTLADSGPGSLRQCAGPGNASVVFHVAGDILLQTSIRVGSFVTIDGSTAPAPGVTLRGAGILISGTHDVIVKNVRVRDALAAPSMDCIQVRAGATRVLIDRVSTAACADGSIDVTGDPANLSGPTTRDVTIRDSIIGPPITGKKAMLIKYNVTRISLLRNLFVRAASRSPEVSRELVGPDPGTTVQMVNNVVWDWGPGYATRIHFGATGNVEANFYADPSGSASDAAQGLIVCTDRQAPSSPAYALCGSGQVAGVQGWAYTHGNVSQDGVNLDAAGNVKTAYPAPAVSVMDACSAARHVLTSAGVRPLDAVDASLVRLVRIGTATCGAPGTRPRSRR